jgi:hypothetical protein
VVNAPAPWVPFTRASCDVGAVAAMTMVLENSNSLADVSRYFAPLPPPTQPVPAAFTRADEGIAIHCGAGSGGSPGGICALAGARGESGIDTNVLAAPTTSPTSRGWSIRQHQRPETPDAALFIVGAGVICAGALLLAGRRRMRHRLA